MNIVFVFRVFLLSTTVCTQRKPKSTKSNLLAVLDKQATQHNHLKLLECSSTHFTYRCAFHIVQRN